MVRYDYPADGILIDSEDSQRLRPQVVLVKAVIIHEVISYVDTIEICEEEQAKLSDYV